ncbi:GGDEF domain-containing protein [Pleionea sp. CnH1-48]|uniref:GGDEF domain-containing protein n=1 Tax=Pleionea sp. CnH1-48 TaxID=2954494 RepID=UPI002096B48F|nr:GGDEF domain-containing protein [Pleionea sp. CnH1-48]MCO7226279.1 GGDEF domain-containing protein [Pleionea sp. CnH1-48]
MSSANNSKSDGLSDEEQLKRFILHVSHSGMGVDVQLDELLRQLRAGLKKNESIEELKSKVDAITSYLRVLEEKVETLKEESAPDAKQLIENFLESLLQEELQRNVKSKLNKLLSKAPHMDETELIQATSNLLGEHLTPKKGGRWSNLFGGGNNEEQDDDAEEDNAPIVQTMAVSSSLQDSLRRFIEQLSVIEAYKDATEHIRKQVELLANYDELVPIIEDIASALLEAANQEHIQFESFLKVLNKRLLHVASYLNQAAVGHKDLTQDTVLLDKELKEQVTFIQREISTATEIGPLKQRVAASFETIFASIERFRMAQDTRVEASLAELDIVKEQLQVTEDEAVRLKENLIEQRFRAHTDPLTQMPNRYAYNERLTQEYSRWRRYRGALSLAVGDLDFFKKINDVHGHSAGDEVLRKVAEIIREGVRESDFAARFGGEEFILLMPETGLVDATKAINKLRLLINRQPIVVADGESINVSMSFGVSEFENSDTAQDVFNRADKALYRAKEKGRNQVCCERA